MRRKQLGLTQQQVAERMHYADAAVISLAEHGNPIPLNRIPWLADALLIQRLDLVRLALSEQNPNVLKILDLVGVDGIEPS